jgi:hypothetical protein
MYCIPLSICTDSSTLKTAFPPPTLNVNKYLHFLKGTFIVVSIVIMIEVQFC